MSDLIAPVTSQPSYFDPESGQRKPEDPIGTQILAVLEDIRTELRILNAATQVGLNLQDDLDKARQDPYFSNPSL